MASKANPSRRARTAARDKPTAASKVTAATKAGNGGHGSSCSPLPPQLGRPELAAGEDHPCGQSGRPFKGRKVVEAYDPAKWPYPREEAAEKEWDETEG